MNGQDCGVATDSFLQLKKQFVEVDRKTIEGDSNAWSFVGTVMDPRLQTPRNGCRLSFARTQGTFERKHPNFSHTFVLPCAQTGQF